MDDSTTSVATFAIAAWGAALSTFLGVRTILSERRKVRIVATPMMFLNGDGSTRSGLDVRFINDGRRPVELNNSFGVVTVEGSYFLPSSIDPRTGKRVSTLPAMLGDGESVKVFFQADSFDDGYMPAKVFVRDTSGREHKRRISKKDKSLLSEMIEKGAYHPPRSESQEMDVS